MRIVIHCNGNAGLVDALIKGYPDFHTDLVSITWDRDMCTMTGVLIVLWGFLGHLAELVRDAQIESFSVEHEAEHENH